MARWSFGLFFLELACPKGCFGKIKKIRVFVSVFRFSILSENGS